MHYTQLLQDFHDTLRGDENTTDVDFRPLYSIDYSDEKQLIKWLDDTITALQDEAAPRMENQFRNIMFYRGIHTLNQYAEISARDFDNQPVTSQNRFVMNHILEFTLQKQARLLRFSPNINVFPWNNSYADRLGSRLGKKIIDSAFYIHGYDSMLAGVTLQAAVCGESFLFHEWDKYAGDKTKDAVVAEERKKALPDLKFTNDSGEEIDLNQIPRVGDHKMELPMPFQVLHEPKAQWKDVNYLFKCTIKHIDEVKAENSDKPAEAFERILDGSSANDYKEAKFEDWGHHVVQWEFYHKATRFVPNGKYAKFYNGILITHGDLPYSHGGLPCSRFTDYDDLINAHGRSFYESLKLPSVMINNMMKVAYRSFVLSAYPKIIMQQDSVNMYSMANGPFVMEYLPGTEKPSIVNFSAGNNDFFPLNDHVEKFMEKNSGTFGISRGDQPANARARSILNFYEEQEQERESSQIRKITAFIEKSAQQVLANSADFYKPDDGRTIRVVGKNNQYKLEKMTSETKLSGSYNVKLERTTALSESKQGRIDQISTLSSMPLAENDGTPGLFKREEILALLEVGDSASFFEQSAAPAEAAASENEDLFEGKDVPAPEMYQAHLAHWSVHYKWIQSREFTDTDGVPKEVKEKTLLHLATHERMLYEKALTNLQLATLLSQNTYFPAVFKLDPAQDLPLSQVVMVLSQPPAPPMPPAGLAGMPPGEGMAPPGTEIPPSDIMPPEAIPEGEAPIPDELAQQDPLPIP